MDRKKRLLNRILIVSGASAVLLLAGYVWYLKRPSYHFYLPEGYKGWVTVRFEKPGAPALPEDAGGGLRFEIPATGIFETSSKYKEGWAQDEYFQRAASGGSVPLERTVSKNNQDLTLVHETISASMAYDSIIVGLTDPSDTLLWDGARISRNGEAVEVRSGRKVLLHFYFSGQYEPYFYAHDSLPPERKFW